MNRTETSDARDRRLAEGRDGGLATTYLVEAGAGTGKTRVLVTRLLSLIEAGSDIARVVAITFTEKAAGELKTRLRTELERRASEGEGRDACREALHGIDRANVGTIHSFCAGLLKERPVEARVDPGFEVADDLRSTILFDSVWDAWLRGELARGLPPALAEARGLGVTLGRVRHLATKLTSHRDLLGAPIETVETGDADALAADLVSAAAEFAALAERHCTDPDDRAARAIRGFADDVRSIDVLPTGSSVPHALAQIAVAPKPNVGSKKNWEAGVLEDLRDRAAALEERRSDLLARTSHNAAVALLAWLAGFVDAYESEKVRLGLLDFDDLLLLARDLLKTDLGAREHFKRAYDKILVDEFQDTDPLQSEIIFYLSEKMGGRALDWRDVEVETGKLFIVGDPKQSIYRFRRADIEAYEDAKEIIGSAGGVLTLKENFRTRPVMLDAVNQVFDGIMTPPEDGRRYQPEYAALVPYRGRENPGPGIVMLPPAEPIEKGTRAPDVRRSEAAAVAAFLAWARDSQAFDVFDRDLEKWRPVDLKDIAILFRTTTALDAYEDALEVYGLDYRIAGGKRFYARREVRELATVLSAIEDPHNAVAVVGALRTPFLGVSDEAILLHRAATGSLDYLGGRRGGVPEVEDAFELLETLHGRRNASSIVSVIEELFDRTGILEVFLLKPSGEQRHANLKKVVELATALERSETMSFGGFAHWLHDVSQLTPEEAESPLSEEGDDFVRVLTLHKAKGLEFPVTVLPDLARLRRHGEDFIVDRATGRFAFAIGSGSERLATLDYDELLELEKRRRDAELLRLLYVGMTRARDLLVVPWFPQPTESGKLGLLEYMSVLERDAGGPVRSLRGLSDRAPSPAVVSFDTSALDLDRKTRRPMRLDARSAGEIDAASTPAFAERDSWRRRLDDLRLVHDRPRVVVSPSSLEAASVSAEGDGLARPSATVSDEAPYLSAAGGEPDALRGPESSREAAFGPAFGTLVHAVMEKLDFDAPDDVAPLARALARTAGEPAEVADCAAALIRQSLESPVMERARSSARAWREVPFCLAIEERTLEGKLDLLFEEDDGHVVVDYKTDVVGGGSFAELGRRYQQQALSYGLAMARTLKLPVKEVVLLFLRGPSEVSFRVDARAEGAERALVQLLDEKRRPEA